MFGKLCSPRALALVLGFICLVVPATSIRAQEKVAVPTGGTLNITVTPASTPAPPVSITLLDRHGHVTPCKGNCTHTGGGLIDVQSPSADTIVITMTGVVVADSSMHFDLEQAFEVSIDDPKVKRAKITAEGRVIGLLRGEKKGTAEYSEACAGLSSGTGENLAVCVSPHRVSGCENLSVNDHDGPKTIPITPGKFDLHQTFNLSAHSDSCIHKRPSAEFAPDPALDPLWINFWEPFHGVKKDQFGFQVTVKVAGDSDPAEAAPAPKAP